MRLTDEQGQSLLRALVVVAAIGVPMWHWAVKAHAQPGPTIVQASCDSGDACKADEVVFNLRDAEPYECFGQGTQTIDVSLKNPLAASAPVLGRAVTASIDTCQAFLNAGGSPYACFSGVFPMKQVLPVAGSTNGVWKTGLCTTYINAIGKFFMKYSVSAAFTVVSTPGMPPPLPRSCNNPIALSQCQVPSPEIAPGVYHLLLSKMAGGGGQRATQLCVDVRLNSLKSGYEQRKCNATDPSEKFVVAPKNANGCYTFSDQATGRAMVTHPAGDSGDIAGVLSWGAEDMLEGCESDDARTEWEVKWSPDRQHVQIRNRATGKCLQQDGDHVADGEKVDAISTRNPGTGQYECRGTQFEMIKLEKLPTPAMKRLGQHR